MTSTRSIPSESKSVMDVPSSKYAISSQFDIASDVSINRCLTLSNGCVVTTSGLRNVDAGIIVFDPVNQRCLNALRTEGYSRDLFVLPDQRLLYNDYNKGVIRILDPSTLKETQRALTQNLRLSNAVMWGKYFVCVDNIPLPNSVILYDFSQQEPVMVRRIPIELGLAINSFAVLSEDKLAIAQGDRVSILERTGGNFRVAENIFLLAPPKLDPLICTLKHNIFLRIDTHHGRIKICDDKNLTIREEKLLKPAPRRIGNKLQMLPDERSLISLGHLPNEIYIWDVQTLQPHVLRVKDAINDFDILPNGNVVIASNSGLICIRLAHLLAYKVINKELEFFPQVLVPILQDYLNQDVRVLSEKSMSYDGLFCWLFSPSEKRVVLDASHDVCRVSLKK